MATHRCVGFLLASVVALALAGPGAGQEKLHPIAEQVKAGLKDPSKPFTLIVQLEAKEGMQAKFETAFAKAVKATRKEKGCITYELNRDAKTPTKYLLYERWQDLPSLDAHLKTPHITTLLKDLEELLAGPPDAKAMLPAGD